MNNYFVDFKELKIVKEYHPLHIHKTFVASYDDSLKSMEAVITQAVENIIPTNITETPTLFSFEVVENNSFNAEAPKLNEKDAYDFVLSLANLIVPTLLQKLETGQGYARERRLGAPEPFKALNTSYSVIKRATNHEMKPSCLNIAIQCGDIFYYLCDGKEINKVEGKETTDA